MATCLIFSLSYENSATKCKYCNALSASEAYFHTSSFVDVLNEACSTLTSKRVEKGKENPYPTYVMTIRVENNCV